MLTDETGFGSYTFHDILLGKVPYPLDGFARFALQEHSEENVYFYREVDDYKKVPDLEKRDVICDTYVKPEAKYEINIGSEHREEILARQQEEKEPKVNLFDKAQVDVYNLVRNDTYPRFQKKIKESNLNVQTSKQALRLGLSFLVVALILTIVTFTLQSICDPETNPNVPEFCASIEIMGNRFWRLLAAPFWMFAVMFILVGYQEFCPICAASGVSFSIDKPRPSYFNIITRKVLPDYIIKAQEVLAANRRKAWKSFGITVAISVSLAVIMVMVPPNNPKLY